MEQEESWGEATSYNDDMPKRQRERLVLDFISPPVLTLLNLWKQN